MIRCLLPSFLTLSFHAPQDQCCAFTPTARRLPFHSPSPWMSPAPTGVSIARRRTRVCVARGGTLCTFAVVRVASSHMFLSTSLPVAARRRWAGGAEASLADLGGDGQVWPADPRRFSPAWHGDPVCGVMRSPLARPPLRPLPHIDVAVV